MGIEFHPKPLKIKEVSFKIEYSTSFNYLFINTIFECPFYQSVSGVSHDQNQPFLNEFVIQCGVF